MTIAPWGSSWRFDGTAKGGLISEQDLSAAETALVYELFDLTNETDIRKERK